MDLSFHNLLSWILGGYFALLPMSNPFSTVPLLVSLTKGQTPHFQRAQGDRAVIFGAIIMLGTLLLGSLIMKFFNISIPALRIAGGFIICFYGFGMLTRNSAMQNANNFDSADDYALVPLAMPSLVGPGTISIIITFSTQINEQTSVLGLVIGYGVVITAIVATAMTSFFVLRSSRFIMKLLGTKGIDVMTRFMGLILVCVGVQFFADGLEGFIIRLQTHF
ncbi:MAG: MarC family NAAT transporter [Pelovirga sp.]